ncbi:MAG: zf-HC2 domain-containing protein [Acidobacteriota bacterium]
MSCADIEQRLPWFANGRLATDERQQVADHLESCARCRQALTDTLTVGKAAQQHLAIDLLLDLADGEELSPADREAADLHLAICPRCRDELSRARPKHEAETQEAGTQEAGTQEAGTQEAGTLAWRGRHRSQPAAFWPAIAAVLLLTTAASLFWAFQRPPTALPQSLVINPPILELVAESPLRGSREATSLRLTDAPSSVALLLISDQRSAAAGLRVEVVAPDGEVIWSRTGLRRSNEGLYSLLLPGDALAAGRHQIVIHAEPVERFLLDVAP